MLYFQQEQTRRQVIADLARSKQKLRYLEQVVELAECRPEDAEEMVKVCDRSCAVRLRGFQVGAPVCKSASRALPSSVLFLSNCWDHRLMKVCDRSRAARVSDFRELDLLSPPHGLAFESASLSSLLS